MTKPYTKEEFWEFYKQLPKELQDIIFDEKTGDNTYLVCKNNGEEEKLSGVVDYVGAVLIGLLSPENFEEALEKILKIDKSRAEKISKEINQLIFRTVRTHLNRLYEIEKIESKKEGIDTKKEDSYREEIQ